MFGSDNHAPAHQTVLAAMAALNHGRFSPYGGDDITQKAKGKIAEVFQTNDLDIYFVSTGGAANGLALSALCPAWGAIITHDQSHLIHDESTGIGFFTGGAATIGIGDPKGVLAAEDVRSAVGKYDAGFVHGLQPKVVSIANLSENGLAYDPDEIRQLALITHEHGLSLHMDGARLANGLVFHGATPADMTWRAGVDALSLGLTKVGAVGAEAVIMFGKARNHALPYLQKRAGQLASKHAYIAAQFVAMLDDDLWLKLAAHANEIAQQLVDVARAHNVPVLSPTHGNEVFLGLTQGQSAALLAAGIAHYGWPVFNPHGEAISAYRFVASWASTAADVAYFAEKLAPS